MAAKSYIRLFLLALILTVIVSMSDASPWPRWEHKGSFGDEKGERPDWRPHADRRITWRPRIPRPTTKMPWWKQWRAQTGDDGDRVDLPFVHPLPGDYYRQKFDGTSRNTARDNSAHIGERQGYPFELESDQLVQK